MRKFKRAPWRARLTLLLSAGALFQAAGCTFDPNETITGLLTTVGTYFINGYVTGLLNVGY